MDTILCIQNNLRIDLSVSTTIIVETDKSI